MPEVIVSVNKITTTIFAKKDQVIELYERCVDIRQQQSER